MANRIALTIVFTLSFATYLMPDLTMLVQIAPLFLFALLVVVRVLFSSQLLPALESLLAKESLLYIFFLSLLVIAPSIQSDYGGSLGFSFMLALCLILARLYMSVVAIQEVLEAFFWSGVISMGLLVTLSFASLMESIQTAARLFVFSFHPNLLGFVLAGYFCTTVWKFMISKWGMRVFSAAVGVSSLVIIFFASSRGSIVAVIAACAIVSVLSICKLPRERRTKAIAGGVLSLALISVVAGSFLKLESVSNALDFTDKVLQLSHPERGMDSGWSGRFDKWQATISALSDGSWFVGHGIRSSDSQDQLIDNSYLVLLYEVGIAPLILVCSRYATTLRYFLHGYFVSDDRESRLRHLSCMLLIFVFLTNNIVARYLLSVGNPFSLMALLMFVTPTPMIAAKMPYLRSRFQGNDLVAG